MSRNSSNATVTTRINGVSPGGQKSEPTRVPPVDLRERPFDLSSTSDAPAFTPGDPLYGSQWHLPRLGDIETIWNEFTGAGLNVGVYDDGLQYTHHDLNGNYDASRHVLVRGEVIDALALPGNGHGTAVSGLIASENNGAGTVGVAFGSTLTGVDIFGGRPGDVNADPSGFREVAAQMSTFYIELNKTKPKSGP